MERPATGTGLNSDESSLFDGVRHALATGHPLDLLGTTSLLIEATTPDPLAFLKTRPEGDQVDLPQLIEGFIAMPVLETSALLTALGALLDDADLRERCRSEVATRTHALPAWLTDLERIDAYRAVRMTHVLGDGDEVLIGARLANGDELTCAVILDHTTSSAIRDAFFVPDAIGTVVAIAEQSNTDPDTTFVEMSLPDARAWLQQGPMHPLFWAESDSWPGCRPLMQWLVGHLPDGGTRYQPPEYDSGELSDVFFASDTGAAFDERYRELLVAIVDAAHDPLRWSVPRVHRALDDSYDEVPPDVAAEVPALLRAFIPFAHARSGIRAELTAEALAAVDESAPLR